MNPKVELLTAAKRYLWDGTAPPNDEVYGHICGALAAALRADYPESEIHKQAYYQITSRIDSHIAPYCYFSTWVKAEENDPHMPWHVVQAKRLEYVEQLIKEYSIESALIPCQNPAIIRTGRGEA